MKREGEKERRGRGTRNDEGQGTTRGKEGDEEGKGNGKQAGGKKSGSGDGRGDEGRDNDR
jgi:hypothetical protein